MRKVLPVVLLMLSMVAGVAAQETDNTYHVKNFISQVAPRTVGAAVTYIQANVCNSNAAIPCVLVFDPSTAVYTQGVLPSPCAQCIWQRYDLFSGASTFSAAGTFTNVSNNCLVQGLVGGGTMALFSSSGAGSYTMDGVCGVVYVPLGSTVSQSNGVTGIVDVHANGPVVTSGPAGMGGYFQTHMYGSNSATWGINTVGVLMAGANNNTLQNEVDFNIQSGVTGAIVNGWSINFINFDSAPLSATGVFVGKPGCATPNFGTYPSTGCPQLGFVFNTTAGSAPVFAKIPENCSGNNCGSEAIQMLSKDSGGVERTATINTDQNGSLYLTPGSAGSLVFGSAIVATSGLTTNSALKVTTTVSADGGGLKHKRVAGCATAAAAGSVCTTVVTWGTAFADANYSVSCSGDVVTSGVPQDGGLSAKVAASATFRTVAATAVAAQYTNVDCIAMHD